MPNRREMEELLPVRPHYVEDARLKSQKKEGRVYRSFADIYQRLPEVFRFTYILLAVAVVLRFLRRYFTR